MCRSLPCWNKIKKKKCSWNNTRVVFTDYLDHMMQKQYSTKSEISSMSEASRLVRLSKSLSFTASASVLLSAVCDVEVRSLCLCRCYGCICIGYPGTMSSITQQSSLQAQRQTANTSHVDLRSQCQRPLQHSSKILRLAPFEKAWSWSTEDDLANIEVVPRGV